MATIPVPFGKSPKGVFPSVNWGDPITKGLVVANHVDGVKGIDLVSRQTFEWLTNSVGSTPVPNNTRFGTATACLHDYGYWGGGTTFNPIAATDDVTVLMWAREDAVTNRGFFRRGKDGSGNGWSLYLKTENSACNPSFGAVWTSPSLVGRAVTNSAASINAGAGSEGMWLLGRYLQGRSLSIFCGNGTVAHDTSSVGSSMRTSTQGIALTGNTAATADNGNYVHFYGTVGNDQFIWARGLSDNECWEILSDPMRVYRRRSRVAVLVTAAGGGAVTLSPTEGHISVVGYSPGLSQARTLAPSTGALHLVGYQPGIVQSAGQTLFPSTGHEVLQGYAPGLSQARTLVPATGTERLQGYVPGVFQSVITTLAPSTGHLVLTGAVPGITQARTLAPSTGHVYLAGYAPVVEQVAGAQTLAPLTGSIILSGYVPTVSNAPSQPSSSSYSFGGGGGGGKRAWKEAGFDEKLDKIVEEWQEQHSPKLASKPAQDPAKSETAPVPTNEAREDEREELGQSALADLIADRVVAKLTPLLASNKQLAEEAFIFRLIQAGKL